MVQMKAIVVIFVCLFMVSSSGKNFNKKQQQQQQQQHPNNKKHHIELDEFKREFVSRSNTGGLLHIKVARKGIYTLDTQTPDLGENGLFLREITNGKKFVQAIYDGKDNLVDCDILPDQDDVVKFVQKFFHGVYKPGVLQTKVQPFHNASYTIEPIYKSAQRHKYRQMTDFRKVRIACKTWMQQQKEYLKKQKNIDVDHLNDAAAKQMVQQQAENEDNNHKAARNYGDEHSRSKRAMWIYPGTKWCGHGNAAKGYEDLGMSIDTDKCCRQHDHCPTTITGFSSKFNFFNFRFNTLSHCHCDNKFRACLKSTSSSVAQMVGNLYFNYVGTKCFKLKSESVCTKRSWWGRCIKYKKVKTATINYSTEF